MICVPILLFWCLISHTVTTRSARLYKRSIWNLSSFFFEVRRSKQYVVGKIHEKCQHAGMFKAKSFESKPQPGIETVLGQCFEQPSGAAFFNHPQVRLDIFCLRILSIINLNPQTIIYLLCLRIFVPCFFCIVIKMPKSIYKHWSSPFFLER